MRNPFEYGTGCTGPEVDLHFGTGFPFCTGYTYDSPTFIYQQYIEPPDIDPPPFCPCIPTIHQTGTFRVGTGQKKFSVVIRPNTNDCCEPEYKFDFNIDIPCLPFQMTVANTKNNALLRPQLRVHKQDGTCKFCFTLESPDAGGIKKIIFGLWRHGNGVTFVNCCEGKGIVDMDMQITRYEGGTVFVDVIHQVDIVIPLISKLITIDPDCLNQIAACTLNDPWGKPIVWNGDRADGLGVLKYYTTDRRLT